jgi:hypothetical protein
MNRIALLMVALGLSTAWARTFQITLFQPSVVAGTELKPGEYRLELNGANMVLKNSWVSVESAVKVEKVGKKYDRMSVRYTNGDGKLYLKEIRLADTDMKLVVDESVGTAAGAARNE